MGTVRDIARRVRNTWRGIDLAPVNVLDLGLDPAEAHGCMNSGGPALEGVLRAMDIRPGTAVIDLGCGKGGALISFARFPFARIAGIEIVPQLVEIARRNLARAGCAGVEVHCADAAAFTALDPFDLVYLFNPFPAPVLVQVVGNLRASLERRPRPLRVLYKNPVDEALLLDRGLFRPAGEWPSGRHAPFRAYEAG